MWCKILGMRNQRGKDSGTKSCETDTRAASAQGGRGLRGAQDLCCSSSGPLAWAQRGISLPASHDMSRTAPKTSFHGEVRPRVQSAGTERGHRLEQTELMQTVGSRFGAQLQREQRGTSGVTPPNAADILLKG